MTPHTRNSPMQALLSIVICTFNRSDYLRAVLEVLDGERSQPVQIVVVENSDDENAVRANQLLFDAREHVHVIRTSPGSLSIARNAAMEQCTTEFIAYIDDDSKPVPSWAGHIIESFLNAGPEVAGVGGPIHPIWVHPRPAWLSDQLLGPLTVLDHGPAPRVLGSTEYIYGANMAFRTKDLRAVGGFDIPLGRLGNKVLLSSDEIEVQDRLRARGNTIYYDPRARAGHVVHQDRLSQQWFFRRMVWQAISDSFRGPMSAEVTRSVSLALENSAKALNIPGVDAALFAPSDDPRTAEARIDFVYYLARRLMDPGA